MRQATHADWQTVQEKGGRVTFKPLGRTQFRCNQLPDLGRLTKSQVESVRNAVAAYGHPDKPRKQSKPIRLSEPPLPTAYVDRNGWVNCPHQGCNRSMCVGINRGQQRCVYCVRPFLAG